MSILVMAFLAPSVTATSTVPIITTQPTKAHPVTLQDQVYELAGEYHQDPLLALRIIQCEGKLYGHKDNQNLDQNGNVWSTDVGPWQINNYYHTARARAMGLDIYDTRDNLRYGFILLREQGTAPWNASRACWQ